MFIKLSHHDTKCLIDLISEISPEDRSEQEEKTLRKLRLIYEAQKMAKNQKGDNNDNS